MNKFNSSPGVLHYPVMLNEVIKLCNPQKGGNYLDCTFGSGGYSKKILLGHDIYSKHRLKKYGGHGYSYILEMILMRMITMGISQKDVNKMIIENPKKILTLV